MPKKYREYSSDEELNDALADPNATVLYNKDGTYHVEYKTDEKPQQNWVYDDTPTESEIAYSIFKKLESYCKEESLVLLNKCDYTDLLYFTTVSYQFDNDNNNIK